MRPPTLVLSLTLCLATAADAKITRYLTGNPGDVSPGPLAGPALNLGGGRPSTGFYTISVTNGVLSGNPY
jgi:hypothetical protein